MRLRERNQALYDALNDPGKVLLISLQARCFKLCILAEFKREFEAQRNLAQQSAVGLNNLDYSDPLNPDVQKRIAELIRYII